VHTRQLADAGRDASGEPVSLGPLRRNTVADERVHQLASAKVAVGVQAVRLKGGGGEG